MGRIAAPMATTRGGRFAICVERTESAEGPGPDPIKLDHDDAASLVIDLHRLEVPDEQHGLLFRTARSLAPRSRITDGHRSRRAATRVPKSESAGGCSCRRSPECPQCDLTSKRR